MAAEERLVAAAVGRPGSDGAREDGWRHVGHGDSFGGEGVRAGMGSEGERYV